MKLKNITIGIFTVLSVLVLVILLANNTPKFEYQLVNTSQINSILTQESLVVLDVRTPTEFTTGHIKGAINLDYYQPSFKNELAKLDKTKKYLVYCRSGNRSQSTVQIMKQLGFKYIYEVNGGVVNIPTPLICQNC